MTEARRIRVLLVDDHPMMRRGLATCLSVVGDLQVVGEAGDGAEAISLCAALQPDVVLMDVMMPDMDGVSATQTIRTQFPRIRILALTSFAEEAVVQRMVQAGAIGYLLKNLEADDLARAIRAAAAGQAMLAPEAMRVLLHPASPPSILGGDLTIREREVLALIVKGLNNTDIAVRLVVSRSTVKSHVSNILAKLGAASRTELVALAIHQHLID